MESNPWRSFCPVVRAGSPARSVQAGRLHYAMRLRDDVELLDVDEHLAQLGPCAARIGADLALLLLEETERLAQLLGRRLARERGLVKIDDALGLAAGGD